MRPIHRRHALGAIAALALSPAVHATAGHRSRHGQGGGAFPRRGRGRRGGAQDGGSHGQTHGHTFIVENRPGASGAIGARAVASAPPDGAMLLYAHSGMVTAQAMGAKIDLLKEFRPVARFTAGPHLLVVRADSPYKTQRDLVDAMKASPGKLNFGSGGPGSPTH
jgi:hypothetical protein